ncbi:MAG: hypothetical protein K9I85_03570 [Saprospiraceae bacterium]|nr:hypothetical protein [Saprospiraceae bacterium]
MLRSSFLKGRLVGIFLASFLWVTQSSAQCIQQDISDQTTPPARLDQWLFHDLNKKEDARSTTGFRMNLASKAWFCRKERELEEWSGVPVRFRLGDQPTVDRLEGK